MLIEEKVFEVKISFGHKYGVVVGQISNQFSAMGYDYGAWFFTPVSDNFWLKLILYNA